MNQLVRLENVDLFYRKKQALNGVSLNLSSGVVGLLGPNGAGKTTIMKVISTLLKPQRGNVSIAGISVSDSKSILQARQSVGYLPQKFDVINGAKLQYSVEYAAWIRGVPEKRCAGAARKALSKVGLIDKRNDKAKSLSGGMRQRLGIACAISNEPKILILDEPTVGLDPAQRVNIRQYIDDYGRDNLVLISTHLIEDLAQNASRVIVMNAGVVLFDGTMNDFAQKSTVNNSLSSPLESAYYNILGDTSEE